MTGSEQTGAINARTRTAKQLARQERVFALSVLYDRSVRAISVEIGIAQSTVITDIRREQERRSVELGERREIEKVRAVAFYEGVIGRAIRKSDANDELIARAIADRTYDLRMNDRALESAIKARERIDKLLGLDAPTKIDLGLQTLLDALAIPDDDKTHALVDHDSEAPVLSGTA